MTEKLPEGVRIIFYPKDEKGRKIDTYLSVTGGEVKVPSGASGPTLTRRFTEGDSGIAAVIWSVMTLSPAQTIILMSAALQRYPYSMIVVLTHTITQNPTVAQIYPVCRFILDSAKQHSGCV